MSADLLKCVLQVATLTTATASCIHSHIGHLYVSMCPTGRYLTAVESYTSNVCNSLACQCWVPVQVHSSSWLVSSSYSPIDSSSGVTYELCSIREVPVSSSGTIATVWVVSEALQGVGIVVHWLTDIIVVHHTVTLDLHTIQLEGHICTCGCTVLHQVAIIVCFTALAFIINVS